MGDGAVQLMPPALDAGILGLIRGAVREDVGGGDRTGALAIPGGLAGTGMIVARKAGVISGMFLLGAILAEYDAGLRTVVEAGDGAQVQAGERVATMTGPVRALLSAERVVLNFLGHLSGVATLTARYVEAVAGTGAVICDTRKTTPGFRVLDKFAVRCGGGINHRMGLFDGVMLKDNHLAALRARLGAGLTLAELTRRVRRELEPGILVWLEVDTLEQFAEALGGGADIVLLDNFTVGQLREAVELNRKSASPKVLEASGGVMLETVGEMARTGVERISVGALTHSAPALDLSLDLA